MSINPQTQVIQISPVVFEPTTYILEVFGAQILDSSLFHDNLL